MPFFILHVIIYDMKYEMQLALGKDNKLSVRRAGEAAVRVCTVKDATKILNKTRRQIYRYLQGGVLVNRGKFLGEWLLDFQSVKNLCGFPMRTQPIPARFEYLFPEYDIAKLNVGKDRVVIISRILEYGNAKELGWLKTRYSLNEIKSFVKNNASRLLTARSLNFWALYYNVTPKKSSWRQNYAWDG